MGYDGKVISINKKESKWIQTHQVNRQSSQLLLGNSLRTLRLLNLALTQHRPHQALTLQLLRPLTLQPQLNQLRLQKLLWTHLQMRRLPKLL
jgi:hypothetical protein